MLVYVYFILFLAFSFFLLRWRQVRYEREHRLAPRAIGRTDERLRPRS